MSTIVATSEAEQRVYIAQWTCWWAAAIVGCEFLVFIFAVVALRHTVIARGMALLPSIVAGSVIMAGLVALFVFAGVLIEKRRRSGAILGILLLLWQVAGAALRATLPRFSGVRVAVAVAAVVAIGLIARAWRDLSSDPA